MLILFISLKCSEQARVEEEKESNASAATPLPQNEAETTTNNPPDNNIVVVKDILQPKVRLTAFIVLFFCFYLSQFCCSLLR